MKKILIVAAVFGVGVCLYGFTRGQDTEPRRTRADRFSEEAGSEVQLAPQKRKPAPSVVKQRSVTGKTQAVTQKTQNVSSRVDRQPASVAQRVGARGPASVPPMSVSANSGSVNRQANFDPSDTRLLEQIARKAREEGSKVAYVGNVQDLYAFNPKFFRKTKGADGRLDLLPSKVESIEIVDSPAGKTRINVQRIPYPIPPANAVDYSIFSRAIMRATEDGAMLINIATNGVQRTYLEDAIQYARNRGVVVVMIPPPTPSKR